ncbi:MAG: YfbM family protein [Gemmatimonadales bacterium]
MGMYVALASLSDATIARLHADPPLVWQIIAPDDPEAIARARGAPKRPGLLARLFGRGAAEAPAPAAPAPLPLAEGEGEIVDLDKSWHGIHYLLTGTAWEGDPPLNFLVTGGREVGDAEVGQGPARTYTAAETREVAGALAALSDAELRSRFAPGDMMRAEIYPEIWDRDPAEDDTLGYLMEYLGLLRTAVATVVERGHGLLVTIT